MITKRFVGLALLTALSSGLLISVFAVGDPASSTRAVAPATSWSSAQLVGFWQLERDATNAVSARGHGTLVGRGDFSDRALALDGGYVAFAKDPALEIAGSLSFCLWMKPEKATATMRLLGKFQEEGDNREYGVFFDADNRLWVFLSDNGTAEAGHMVLCATAAPVNANGRWQHLAVTWDASVGPQGLAIYLDGYPQQIRFPEVSPVVSLLNGNAPLVLGTFDPDHAAPAESFHGSIARLMLFRGVLSAPEIAEICNQGRDPAVTTIISLSNPPPTPLSEKAQKNKPDAPAVKFPSAAPATSAGKTTPLILSAQADANIFQMEMDETDSDSDGLTDSQELAGWDFPIAWGDDRQGESATRADALGTIAVSAGGYHSMALLSDGHVIAWGNNFFGQCNVPADVTNAIAISAGGGCNVGHPSGDDGGHSMALLADGQVRCWGWNMEGECDIPDAVATGCVKAIAAAGFHSVAVMSNGTVQFWGYSDQFQTPMPTNLTNVVSAACGDAFTIVLKQDGSLAAWGYDDCGQSTIPADLGTNVAAIAAGARTGVALLKNGHVRCWGRGDSGQTNVPSNVTNAVAIAAGDRHAMALLADHSVVTWGANDLGQRNIPACVTNALAIAACGVHSIALAHVCTDPNNPDTDGDGLSDYDELYVYHTNPCDPDTDHDGMPDGWEIEHGLNPNDPADATQDPNNNGVDNLHEYYNNTDPHAPEYSGTFSNVCVRAGSATNAVGGTWAVQGSNALVCSSTRGFAEYSLTAPAANMYCLQVVATYAIIGVSCSPADPVYSSDLLAYIDGVFVGRKSLITPPGVDSTMQILTPWLSAGPHTVRLCWENVHSLVGINVKSVTLQQRTVDGQDWVADAVASQTGLDNVSTQSVVSPVCIEGTNRFANLTAVSVNSASNLVKSGVLGRWYSNVPLATTGSTTVAVTFDSGVRTITTNIAWVPLNLSYASNLTIRANDSLMLTAHPTGQTSGTVAIQVVGLTNFNTTVSAPVVCLFPTGGVYQVSGTWQGTNAGTITVTVIQASFPSANPACMFGTARTWSCPSVPSSVYVASDSSVALDWASQVATINMSEIYADHYIVARTSPGGPILDSRHLDGFWVQAAVDSYFWVTQTYQDGSQLWADKMFTKNVPATVSIKITVFITGVTLDDGTTVRWITSADLDPLGTYTFGMLRPASNTHSTCHTISVYQGSDYLGDAYYSGYLIP